MELSEQEIERLVDRDLVRRGGSGALAYLAGTVAILATTGQYTQHPVFSWSATAVGLVITGLRLLLHRIRPAWPAARKVSWRTSFRIIFVANGLYWGMFAAELVQQGATGVPSLLAALTTAGLAMGGVTVAAPDVRLAVTFAIVILLPPAVAMAGAMGTGAVAMGTMLLIYVGFSSGMAKKLNGEYWSYLRANLRLQEQAVVLAEARKAAEEGALAKSEFLATMSHEIRTPMNGVIGMADLLLESEITGEPRDHAETIRTSGSQLLALVDDILDYSKMDGRRMVLQQAPLDPQEMVDEVLGMLAGPASAKGLELVHVPAVAPRRTALVDPARLRQIVMNIVNNAIKFTAYGEVIARTWWDDDDGDRPRFVLAVSDTGVGMSAEVQQRIFDPFSQVDSSTTRRFGGTGLGLAIVGRICEAMEGAVEVKSVSGEGSTFTVRLPLEACAPAGEPAAPLPAPSQVRVVTRHVPTAEAVEAAFGGGATRVSMGPGLDGVGPVLDGETQVVMLDSELVEQHATEITEMMVRPELAGIGWVEMRGFRDGDREHVEGIAFKVRKPPRAAAVREACARAVGLVDAATPDRTPTRYDFGLRVLVVEDNDVNQKVVVGMLRKLGCKSVVASNGLEATRTAAEEDFDLILMDCQMPVMSGLEATRAIRKLDGVRSRVPIYALTAAASASDREQCLEAGMDGYLAKPMKRNVLMPIIAELAATPATV